MEPLPRALLMRAIDVGVLDRCRAIAATRWPKRLPGATEDLTLRQAVITDRLLAHEKLRTLRVHAIVASPSLRHTGLTRLGTHCMGPVIDALESAELPSLEELHLSGIGQSEAPAERLGAALRRLPARRLTLGILGRAGKMGWTDEEARALSPVAERISGLILQDPFVAFDVALPNLRRLSTSIGFRGPTAATGFVWPDVGVDELHVLTSHNIDFAELIRSFHASALARRLRVLHWEFSAQAMSALADRPFESLEELSVLPTDTMNPSRRARSSPSSSGGARRWSAAGSASGTTTRRSSQSSSMRRFLSPSSSTRSPPARSRPRPSTTSSVWSSCAGS